MAEKLTPETEECYKRVPASFPEDWFDWSGPGDQGLKLKKETITARVAVFYYQKQTPSS